MRQIMILTGEINLKTVTDPTVPFRQVTKALSEADLVFANLECLLADPPAAYATQQAAFHRTREGFYAGAVAGEALKLAGFAGVGCANNVTYGEEAIRASLAQLQELGMPVTGAGLNRDEHGVKYHDYAKRILAPEDIDRVHDMVENLERLADIRQLIALLAPSPKA